MNIKFANHNLAVSTYLFFPWSTFHEYEILNWLSRAMSCFFVARTSSHSYDNACSSRMMTTTNFTKYRAFCDRARSGSFLGDERCAGRKFRWDLRRSLARKSIAITGTDRAARLISRTIYDSPAVRDRSRRSPNELGIDDWSGAAKRGFQVCRWKWRTFRLALQRKPHVDTAISNRYIFYALFAENSKCLSGTRE